VNERNGVGRAGGAARVASARGGTMSFYGMILGILGVWRVAHLLNAEDGPADLLVRLRRRAGHGFWGGLLDCFYCLSLWLAAPFAIAIGGGWADRLLLWPALSAGAVLLERVAAPRLSAPPAPYFEEEEKGDVLLRQEAGRLSGADNPPSGG
jgi:hypothetical protein